MPGQWERCLVRSPSLRLYRWALPSGERGQAPVRGSRRAAGGHLCADPRTQLSSLGVQLSQRELGGSVPSRPRQQPDLAKVTWLLRADLAPDPPPHGRPLTHRAAGLRPWRSAVSWETWLTQRGAPLPRVPASSPSPPLFWVAGPYTDPPHSQGMVCTCVLCVWCVLGMVDTLGKHPGFCLMPLGTTAFLGSNHHEKARSTSQPPAGFLLGWDRCAPTPPAPSSSRATWARGSGW